MTKIQKYYLEQVEAIPSQIPGLMGSADLNMNIISMNLYSARKFGFDSVKAVMGRNQLDLPMAEFYDIYEKDDKLVRKLEKDCYFLECTRFNTGEVNTVLAHKSPLYNRREKLIGVFSYCHLVTRQSVDQILRIVSDNLMVNFHSMRLMNKYKLLVNGILVILSKRETQILFFLMHGFIYREISRKLFLSIRTVETYVASLKEKLNCKDSFDMLKLICDNQQLDVIPKSVFEICFNNMKNQIRDDSYE